MAWTDIDLEGWVNETSLSDWVIVNTNEGDNAAPFVPLPLPKRKVVAIVGIPCKRQGVVTGKTTKLVYPSCPGFPGCTNRPAYVPAVTICRGEVK